MTLTGVEKVELQWPRDLVWKTSLLVVVAESRVGEGDLRERSPSVAHACGFHIEQIDCRFLFAEDRQIPIRRADAQGLVYVGRVYCLTRSGGVIMLLAVVKQHGPFSSSVLGTPGFEKRSRSGLDV